MNNNIWHKTTKYNFFGIKFFTKEEICKEVNYKGDALKVYITPEYYKEEFSEREKKG